jgi:thiol-disulfide isomerase/thioredoxin
VKAEVESPGSSCFFRWTWLLGVVTALFLGGAPSTPAAPSPEPDSSTTRIQSAPGLLNQALPDWGDLHFLDVSHPRHPSDFRGHVLVIRFWTAGCPRCRASAGTLADWSRRYGGQGLEVIGIYLPKDKESVDDSTVRKAARDLGLEATLAVDTDWSALRRLWEHGGSRFSVSVSLLVDREGVVRAVHRGGYLTEEKPASREETRGFRMALEKALGWS